MATLAIRILIANSCPRRRRIFQGLSQDRGQAKLAEKLRVSPCNKVLSSETTFSLNHLAEQYTVIKVSGFPVPSRDVTYQTHPAGDGNTANLFYSVPLNPGSIF